MLFIYGQDVQKFTQPWASSFYSLVPHLWDKKGQERRKGEKQSVVLGSCRQSANHSLLLMAMNSSGPEFGKPDICWGAGGTEILRLSVSAQISISIRTRGLPRICPWHSGEQEARCLARRPLEGPRSPLPRAPPCPSLGTQCPASPVDDC